jgi:hypothetical protein
MKTGLVGALLAVFMALALPAYADMYPDASNAKLPEASRNLGQSFVVKPGGDIQTALTAAMNNGGGVVNVQAATYELPNLPLQIGSNTKLQCEKGVVLHQGPTGVRGFIENFNYGNVNKLDHDIVIEGCTFNWSLPLSTDGGKHAINLWQFRRATIRNNVFTSAGDATSLLGGDTSVVEGNSHGTIVTGATHSNTTVDGLPCTTACGVYVGSTIASGQGGIPINSYVTAINSATSVTISAAATKTAASARIGLNSALNACYDHWDAWVNASVTNNKCVTSRSGIVMTGSSTNPSANVSFNGTVTGNQIEMVGEGASLWAIVFDGSGNVGAGVHNGTATGNVIRGDNLTRVSCFLISDGTRNIVVSGNVCADTGPNSIGVRFGGSGVPYPTDISFFNNNFHNINVGAGDVAVIQLNGPNATAIGNVISGTNAYYALVWATEANPVIINNIGATGTGPRIDASTATNPVVVDTTPSGLVVNGFSKGSRLGVSALATWPNNQTCTAGEIMVDAGFIYVCTAANTVKRAALVAF